MPKYLTANPELELIRRLSVLVDLDERSVALDRPNCDAVFRNKYVIQQVGGGMTEVTRIANYKDVPKIKPTTKARGGVTGHNVRYVLAFGLGGVIIAFLIIAFYFYGVQF